MKLEYHACDRCGDKISSGHYLASLSQPGYRWAGERWELCKNCKEKLEKFMAGKLYKHAYQEFALPCPHHVPCVENCQGTAYRRVW